MKCVHWWIGPKLCAFNVCDFQTKNNLVGHKYTVSCPSECEGIRHVQISARRCLSKGFRLLGFAWIQLCAFIIMCYDIYTLASNHRYWLIGALFFLFVTTIGAGDQAAPQQLICCLVDKSDRWSAFASLSINRPLLPRIDKYSPSSLRNYDTWIGCDM